MAATTDQQKKNREDSEAVDNFSKRYYEIMDTRRQDIAKFYQAQAKLIWNGTEISGRDAIGRYLINLPPTRHQTYSLDFFPMKDLFPNEPITYQVFISGAVMYGNPGNASSPKEKRLFSHVFVLTVESSVWVIANECFRFHE